MLSGIPGQSGQKGGLVGGGKDDQNEPKAGGDIVTAIDNAPVAGVPDILSYLNGKQPGDKVTLTVLRAGQNSSYPLSSPNGRTKCRLRAGVSQAPTRMATALILSFHLRIK